MLVAPSPKFHDHDVGLPLDRSVKFTPSGRLPDVGEPVKFAVGGGGGDTLIYPAFVSVSEPCAFVAVRITVYVPALLYVWEGFFCVLVPPSPKFHDHDVGEFVERSVKFTFKGV